MVVFIAMCFLWISDSCKIACHACLGIYFRGRAFVRHNLCKLNNVQTSKKCSFIIQEELNYFLHQNFFMTSTRKQKAEARELREMDILSDYDNMDIGLGERNSYST